MAEDKKSIFKLFTDKLVKEHGERQLTHDEPIETARKRIITRVYADLRHGNKPVVTQEIKDLNMEGEIQAIIMNFGVRRMLDNMLDQAELDADNAEDEISGW